MNAGVANDDGDKWVERTAETENHGCCPGLSFVSSKFYLGTRKGKRLPLWLLRGLQCFLLMWDSLCLERLCASCMVDSSYTSLLFGLVHRVGIRLSAVELLFRGSRNNLRSAV